MMSLAPFFAIFSIALFFGAPARAADLVIVEQSGCHWCARWNDEIAPIYPKTSEGKFAPLRRIGLHEKPQGFSYARRINFTPTFVLIDSGKELGRIEGYPGEDFFWPLLEKLLRETTEYKGVNGS